MTTWYRKLATGLALLPLVALAGQPNARAGDVEATVRANPMSMLLEVSSDTVETGRRFRAVAVVENVGAAPVSDVTLVIHTPEDVQVSKDVESSVKRIRGGGTGRGAWQLCADAPVDLGGYLLVATGHAVGADGAEYTFTSNAVVVQATAGRRPCS
jgi:hypothetical protein